MQIQIQFHNFFFVIIWLGILVSNFNFINIWLYRLLSYQVVLSMLLHMFWLSLRHIRFVNSHLSIFLKAFLKFLFPLIVPNFLFLWMNERVEIFFNYFGFKSSAVVEHKISLLLKKFWNRFLGFLTYINCFSVTSC